jgi:hypothetical protein
METSVEQRFERIERNLEATNATLALLAISQTKTNEAVSSLTQTVDAFVNASTARMARIEAGIENLIRVIASEHGNGKK